MGRRRKSDQGPENRHLQSWDALNKALKCMSENDAWELLDEELDGYRRYSFVMRIHGRANRVRADKERAALRAIIRRPK